MDKMKGERVGGEGCWEEKQKKVKIKESDHLKQLNDNVATAVLGHD